MAQLRECNFTMLGEKDHGKSTLIGNLLIQTGHTTEERIKEAKKAGKRFEPAHILDSFSFERENEMTLDTTRAQLVYKDMIMRFIDIPGHLELINNALSGASNADIAVVMVSSKKEEGFTEQTRRHIYIGNMLGMRAFVFAINKMDLWNYDQKVFESIKSEIKGYLDGIGLKKPVEFVPISAYDNENMAKKSEKMGWYKGEPLLETTYAAAGKYSKIEDPAKMDLRVLVQDSDLERNAAFGIIYYGRVKEGDPVTIYPSGAKAKIKEMYVGDKRTKSVAARKNVSLLLDGGGEIPRGSIISRNGEKIAAVGSFSCRLFITGGFDRSKKDIAIRMNNMKFNVSALNPVKEISPVTGEQVAPREKVLRPNFAFSAKIELREKQPVEKFDDFEDLGRFSLYSDEKFVGFGIVE
jgi:sulfate adenylyltransferase subunit 1